MSGVEEAGARSRQAQKRKRKASPSKAAKSKKKATQGKGGKDSSRKPKGGPKDGPKRPAGAYLLFLKDFRRGFLQARPDVKVTSREIASACGAAWRVLSPELKQLYEARGDAEKAKYAAAKKAQAARHSTSQDTDGASPLDYDGSELSGSQGSDAEEEEQQQEQEEEDEPSVQAAALDAANGASDAGAEVAWPALMSQLEEAAAADSKKPKCAAVAAAAAAGDRAVGAPRARKLAADRPAAAAAEAAAAAAAGQLPKRHASMPPGLPPRPPAAPAAAPAPPMFAGGSIPLRRTPAANSSTMLSALAMPPPALSPIRTSAGAAGAAGAALPAPADNSSVTGFSAFVQECRAAFQLANGVVDGTLQMPEIVLQASQTWLLLHPWQRTQWAAKQALSLASNPELGMHDLLPGLDQYLVSLAMQAVAHGPGGGSTVGAAGAGVGMAGSAAGLASHLLPPPGGTFAALQQLPASWAAAPAGTLAGVPVGAAGSGEERSAISDKHCLLALLLASDAGPPPTLLSLDATAHEVRDVLARMPQLPSAAAAGAAGAAGVSGAAGAAGSLYATAGGMPAELFSVPGAVSAAPGEADFYAPFFPSASAPLGQGGMAQAVAAPVERAHSPGILIWPTGGSTHMDDPADSWQV